jgi:hypothetical protein
MKPKVEDGDLVRQGDRIGVVLRSESGQCLVWIDCHKEWWFNWERVD